MMNYKEALTYLDSFINYEKHGSYDYKKSFKLGRMKRLSALLKDPHEGILSVHVAGSKGKGSTAAFIQSILRSAGYKVGLYTSPHLVSFRERIKIGDAMVSEEDLCSLINEVRSAVDRIDGDRPSFFEVYTAIAFLYFKMKKADIAVYEVGLGGRLDATNVIKPLVSAITPISYEHTDKLGSTLSEIAGEKAGIIKEGGVCVSAPQETEAKTRILSVCAERGARCVLVGRDVTYDETSSGEAGMVFNVNGRLAKYEGLRTSLIGSHQVVNAAVAIAAAECLAESGVAIAPDAVKSGIASARWPGRLEIAGRDPLVLLDGAQNRASARVLKESVERIFGKRKLILVFGASADKDIAGMLDELLPISRDVILTRSKVIGRAADPDVIKDSVKRTVSSVTGSVNEAIDKALSIAGGDDVVLITGSLFIVGEARERLIGQT